MLQKFILTLSGFVIPGPGPFAATFEPEFSGRVDRASTIPAMHLRLSGNPNYYSLIVLAQQALAMSPATSELDIMPAKQAIAKIRSILPPPNAPIVLTAHRLQYLADNAHRQKWQAELEECASLEHVQVIPWESDIPDPNYADYVRKVAAAAKEMLGITR